MDRKIKILILIIVAGLAGILWAAPFGKNVTLKSNPEKLLSQAKAAGRPVFLEFYADW